MEYLFSNNSTWDLTNHIAIPTIKYIKETTGLDLITDGHEIITTADAYVKRLTLEAKDNLFYNKSNDTKNVLSYNIAYTESYNEAWLRYVSEYVWGSIFDPTDAQRKVFRARKNIDIYNFTSSMIDEVENSDLEW